jgi:hypothetical protein
MPVDWKRYPRNWNRVVKAIRRRSQDLCEWCGAENYAAHPITGSKVVLTTAHLGEPFAMKADKHDKHDIRAENLAHLCQRCHLRHDIEEHKENARKTRERKRALNEPTLFEL